MQRASGFLVRHGFAATALALSIALVPALAPSSARADSVNGQWLPSAIGDPSQPINTGPQRTSASMVFDSVHDRLVMMCGDPGPTNDVWTLDLTQPSVWVRVSPAGPRPAARYGQMAVYDPVNDRIILFGGYIGIVQENDVWQLKLTGTPMWTLLTPSGSPPSVRQNGAAIYDPIEQRMIVFGGASSAGFFNDLYALSLSGAPAWTQLSPDGPLPPARDLSACAYDADRGSMIVFGGWDGTNYLGDTWELTLEGSGSWAPISASGGPSARREAVGAYDPASQRFVIFGGINPSYINETWQLSIFNGLVHWARLSAGGGAPTPRGGAAGCLDPVGHRFAVFGGYDGNWCSDLRFLSLSGSSAWSSAFGPGPNPISSRRDNASVIWPEMRQMFTFGGTGPLGDSLDNNEVWKLDVSSMTLPWVQLPAHGPTPTPRHGHRAVWDPDRQSMLVFGGFDASYRNDLWELPATSTQNAWTALTPQPPGTRPPGRANFGLGYDPVRGQLVVVGGNGASSFLNDVWVLPLVPPNLPTWTPLTPSGVPPDARAIYGMQYDPDGDRMMFFGGKTAVGESDEVWALNLSGSMSWEQLFPSGTPPSAREGHSMAYDSQNQRMLIFGGYDGSYENDAWALSLGASPAWTELVPIGGPPPGRSLISSVYDAGGSQMLFMGGWTGSQRLGDTWALNFVAPVIVAVPVSPQSSGFSLDGARPNPSRGDHLTIAFSLPRAEPARLEVLDLAGRRVASRDVSAGAGRQVISVTPSRALNPGVYVVRLMAAEGSRSAKVAVVR